MESETYQRVQRIKGYTGRMPEDDAKFLITLAERLDEELTETERAYAHIASKLKTADKKLKREKVENCPCNMPDNHAGWCPRRER